MQVEKNVWRITFPLTEIVSPPLFSHITDTYSQFVFLRPFEQNLRWLLHAALSTTEYPDRLSKCYPNSPIFSFFQSLIFFFYHWIPLLYQRDVKTDLSQSLSCLYSRSAESSNSTPAKIKQGSHRIPREQEMAVIWFICKLMIQFHMHTDT